MATTMVRTQRQATPERWQAALQRAIEQGVEPLQIAGTGEWVVTSATRGDTVYRCDGVGCECAAALLGGDEVCTHRAAVRYVLGTLPEPDRAPATTPVYDVLIDGVGYRSYGSRDEAEAEANRFSRWKSTSTRVVVVERAVPAAVVLPPRAEPVAPVAA